LAKSILEKWNREKFNIKTTYDEKGDFDKGYKSLQIQLEKERRLRKKENQDSDEEEVTQKRQKLGDTNALSEFNRDHQ
jgi:hypothetical protein